MDKSGELRYQSLVDRSCKQLLRYKIFESYNASIGQVENVDLRNFEICANTPVEFSQLYADMSNVRKFNKAMSSYAGTDINKDKIKDFKKEYKNYFKNKVLNEEKFEKEIWKDHYVRKCEYCGITELEIEKLIEKKRINTKRLYSRGRTMEVDRATPNGEYNSKNIILSCYWCNNAKTDEFSYEEFKKIAEGFKEVWKKRLSF